VTQALYEEEAALYAVEAATQAALFAELEKGMAAEASRWEMTHTAQQYHETAQAARDLAAVEETLAGAVEAVVAPTMELDEILSATEEALAAVGIEGVALDGRMAGLEVTLGSVSEAEAKLEQDVALVAEAFAEGSLSAEAFSGYMEDAAAGTLDLSDAQREGISHALEHAQAQREAAAAADEYRLAILAQSEALLDAAAQQAAQIALQGLREKYDAGLLSLDLYEAATISVQDAYGLATPQSRALAEAIAELNEGLASGRYAPEEYAQAVEAARAAAEGGEDSVLGLMTAVEEAVGPLGAGADAMTEVGDSAGAASGQVDALADSVGRATQDLENLTGQKWVVRVGTSGTLPPGVGPVALAVGAWEVGQDMLAVVHKGEMVWPASLAEGMRDAMSVSAPPVFPAPTVAGTAQPTNDYVTYEVTVNVERVGDEVDVERMAYRVAEEIQRRQRG
jgi:hypothetical protein